jgi:aspartate oxidase
VNVVRQETDVLVVGAGLSGTRAAIAAADASPDLRIMIVAPARPGVGGCGWETHGVHAAVLGDDTAEAHLSDTLAAGAQLNQEPLARVLCEGMPAEIDFLSANGVAFSQLEVRDDVDDDLAAPGRYGGSSVSRSLHLRDMTGLAITQSLLFQLILRNVTTLSDHWLLDLLTSPDGCEGVLLLNVRDQAVHLVRAKAVVLATGGGAWMYPARSVSRDKRATGIARALRAGPSAIDMEMVQFHPTGFRNDGGPGNGALLEEELRTQGGILRNAAGLRFMPDYDERAELATRDVVARAIYAEMDEGERTVTLDLSTFERSYIRSRFPNTLRRLREYGFDLASEPIVPVTPSAHFLMGGVVIDPRGQTSIPRLFCCGEDAGGVHGANRMGGNGVAEALVFGGVAGRAAALASGEDSARSSERTMNPVTIAIGDTGDAEVVMEEVRRLMWRHCSPIRTSGGLATLNRELDRLEAFGSLTFDVPELEGALGRLDASKLAAVGSTDNALLVARGIARAAAWRRNSAGSHYVEDGRDDWPQGSRNSCVRLSSPQSAQLEVDAFGSRTRWRVASERLRSSVPGRLGSNGRDRRAARARA